MKNHFGQWIFRLNLLAGFKPATSSLPRYNPKQKGHCPPQNTSSKHLKHHNILCFFFPRISLAVSLFPDLTAKYSQYRFHAVFPRFFPPFELPVSAPLLRGFSNLKSTSNSGPSIDSLTLEDNRNHMLPNSTLNCSEKIV